MNTKQTGR